jgi:hypothetical protein
LAKELEDHVSTLRTLLCEVESDAHNVKHFLALLARAKTLLSSIRLAQVTHRSSSFGCRGASLIACGDIECRVERWNLRKRPLTQPVCRETLWRARWPDDTVAAEEAKRSGTGCLAFGA